MNEIIYEHVTKAYPSADIPAVNDVSFEVKPGSFVVFLGPSGCGKTTLLKMTNRLYEPTSGTIYLNGQDILQLEAVELRRQTGYVIQQIGLFPHMTVEQNIAVVPRLLYWDQPRIDDRTDELLDLVGLPPAEFRKRYPSQLSGGQQQRVGLVRALAADPEVLLMDEPFGAIDAITRSSLQKELLRLQRRLQKTILFVTHDVDEALLLADKIVVLREGRLVQYDEPCNILNTPANDFVRQLLDTDDRIRQLGILRVESVMQPMREVNLQLVQSSPVVQLGTDLREALGLLLQPGVSQVTIMDAEKPVGWLDLKQVSRAGCENGDA